MDKINRHSFSIHNRKWGLISFMKSIDKVRKQAKKKSSEQKPPKRLKTDFFPNREKGRRRYRERTYFLISPESRFKIFWSTFKILSIITEAILIPYCLSFLPSQWFLFQRLLGVIEIFFAVDILFKFNTEVYHNGVIRSSRLFIAKNYIKTWFFVDILAIFPFEFIISGVNLEPEGYYVHISNLEALKYLWLLKLVRIPMCKTLIYDLEDYYVSSALIDIIRSLKFLFVGYIWIHWLGCIIYSFFARGLKTEGNLWYQYIPNAPDMYLRYFYLVMETMTSVGYGDILPVTTSQHIVYIISMCFACVLFGHIVGNIQGFIENYNAEGKYYEKSARMLKNHLRQHKLPPELRHRVIQYIYYLKTASEKNDPNESGILGNLSAPLREEIYALTRGDLLTTSAAFRSYNGSFLKYLGQQMKNEVFAPGDLIFKEGEMTNDIYFLCSGKVQIYHESTKTVFKDIKKNKYFGEIAFFLNKARSSSAMCLEFAEFLTLDRNSFFDVLNSRPKETEITKVIICYTEKYNNLSLLGIRCYLCRKLGHIARNCKSFIYIPDKLHFAKRAESKKYMNEIRVKDSSVGTEFQRKNLNCNYFNNYGLHNTHGKSFTPGGKYIGKKSLISKSWSIEKNASKFFYSSHMKKINEVSVESESDLSEKRSLDYQEQIPNSEYFITFGRPE
jgi:Cyclic nucleotide-binding domain/Ion transport protein/Zinc knuckle